MTDYSTYKEQIAAATKHNQTFHDNWPWKRTEITALAIRAAIVEDHARAEARRMRHCASNAVKINNHNAACYFTKKAEQFSADAIAAANLLSEINTWAVETQETTHA